MNKKLYIFLNIITLGIYSLIIHLKAKKASSKPNTQLKTSNKGVENANDFVLLVGGANNIVSVEWTISTINFILKKPVEIDPIKTKELQIKGVMKGKDKISFVIGDNAEAIGREIKLLISSK